MARTSRAVFREIGAWCTIGHGRRMPAAPVTVSRWTRLRRDRTVACRENVMPFAGEFRSGMRFPGEGASVGRFIIESIRVEHVGAGAGRYEYPIELVVSGKGGKDGARKALKPLLSGRATIFSGYG